MEKETLEEAAENKFGKVNPTLGKSDYRMGYESGLIAGAKWQQEQILQFLYSEITERRPYSPFRMCEEVIKFIEQRDRINLDED
jgi:hypothetical protein